MPTNIGQIRAKAAWEFAEAKKTNGKIDEKYKTCVNKFPMYVKTNGLVNAIAFAQSKSDWKPLYEDLQIYFRANDPAKKDPLNLLQDKFNEDNSLMEVLVNIDDNDILARITMETFALFTWLKRFVSND